MPGVKFLKQFLCGVTPGAVMGEEMEGSLFAVNLPHSARWLIWLTCSRLKGLLFSRQPLGCAGLARCFLIVLDAGQGN